ncbi:hypothetical protein O181_082850 [Austropuccinia psidii MF-1]|uniref:DUF4939 domain-containing protein n=1 Tax=Austropuccinia psidii MF-1 TaxID=1389203 RepID=A0A9Q3FM06_9BASI|nr:hypothetical protein [Austropuccinia psidii MF-1]
MANIQEVLSSEASTPPAFNTPFMKEPECFDGTQKFKVSSFIQGFQLIFHNDLANFSEDRKKVLYTTSLVIFRVEKWIEAYFSNLTNEDPEYLLKNWESFESQLFTFYGDANEFRKAEAEMTVLRIK